MDLESAKLSVSEWPLRNPLINSAKTDYEGATR